MARRRKILLVASGGDHTGYIVGVFEQLRRKDGSLDIDVVVSCGGSWSEALVEKYADRVLCVPKLRLPR